MTTSNCSPPPRASTSSTARAPAMPLPTTTNFCFGITLLLPFNRSDFDEANVEHDGAVCPRGRAHEPGKLALGRNVLCDGKRHMLARPCPDREVAHEFSVPHQGQIDHLATSIPG